MHFRFQALLGIVLVLAFCFSGGGYVSGQPTQTDIHNQLVKAFVLVQQADNAGASPDQIAELANNLNLALRGQENSNYTNESARLTATAAEALSFANAAREQVFFRQAVAYSTAVGAGFAAALLVTEFHRIGEFTRRLRLRLRLRSKQLG